MITRYGGLAFRSRVTRPVSASSTQMLNDLYSDQLLAAAASLPPARRLENPDATATRTSRVCGSEVSVDLIMRDDVVRDFGLEARACALGQASAGLTAANLIGSDREGLYQLRDEMQHMLDGDGEGPSDPRWAGLHALKAIRDYPQRHESTMLVFQAVADCLDQLRAKS